MTQRLKAHFNDYAEYHRTRGNQLTHYFGIPMIVVSTLGLLSMVVFGGTAAVTSGIFRMDLAVVLMLFGIPWYLYLDWKIAGPYTLVLIGMYFLGRGLPLEVLIGLQIVGWIIQYVGHIKYEKKSPAFYKNLKHLLIGPLWVFAKIVGYVKAPAPEPRGTI